MKVFPERETVWSWLSSTAALVGKVFELPVAEASSTSQSYLRTQKKTATKDLPRTTTTASMGFVDDSKVVVTGVDEDDLVPDLKLVDDTLN